MAVPNHGSSCRQIKCYCTVCPDCGVDVFYWECSCGSKVFFESIGNDWPKHQCLPLENAPIDLDSSYVIVALYNVHNKMQVVTQANSRRSARWHYRKAYKRFENYKEEGISLFLFTPIDKATGQRSQIERSEPNIHLFFRRPHPY